MGEDLSPIALRKADSAQHTRHSTGNAQWGSGDTGLSKTRSSLPPPVAEALRTLGAGLRNARLRRRVPMTYAADRALISRSTLHKVERGDPAVSLGIYATVLFYYGMIERLEHLMDVRRDWIALGLEEERLPRRVRRPTGVRNVTPPV